MSEVRLEDINIRNINSLKESQDEQANEDGQSIVNSSNEFVQSSGQSTNVQKSKEIKETTYSNSLNEKESSTSK